ncbi:MAG: hypothetical protein N3F09_06325 [Bacteroidia bacterium]|nr:hypothetical protein [Bacteroidia bacterium]
MAILKLYRYILLFPFLFFLLFEQSAFSQQDHMFREKRFRKKVWRRWKKNQEAYNPYLGRKSKHRPSKEMAIENYKVRKKQEKIFRKMMRKNKKKYEKRD